MSDADQFTWIEKIFLIMKLKREFHCGTGLPWSDYEGYELPQDLGLMSRISIFF